VTVTVGSQRRKGWVQLLYAGAVPMDLPARPRAFAS